jgi:hypothetical protein
MINTTYLTSRDRTWIIPKDIPFQALGDDKKLATYSINDDLLVIYKGRYLELEKEADLKILKTKKEGNSRATLLTSIGTVLGGVVTFFMTKKKKNG